MQCPECSTDHDVRTGRIVDHVRSTQGAERRDGPTALCEGSGFPIVARDTIAHAATRLRDKARELATEAVQSAIRTMRGVANALNGIDL